MIKNIPGLFDSNENEKLKETKSKLVNIIYNLESTHMKKVFDYDFLITLVPMLKEIAQDLDSEAVNEVAKFERYLENAEYIKKNIEYKSIVKKEPELPDEKEPEKKEESPEEFIKKHIIFATMPKNETKRIPDEIPGGMKDMSRSQFIEALKELKYNAPSIREVATYLNENDIDYTNWTDIEMYLKYYEDNNNNELPDEDE